MDKYKYIGGPHTGEDCVLQVGRPDGYEWASEKFGHYRVVRSGSAGPYYAGYCVCIDPLPKKPTDDFLAVTEAKGPNSKKFKVYRDSELLKPIQIEADNHYVENEVLCFDRDNKRVAAFWGWDYVVEAE